MKIAATAVVAVMAGCMLSGCSPTGGSSSSSGLHLHWTDDTPAWSPDGRSIVFSSNRADHKRRIEHLYVMKANGTAVRRITWDTVDAEGPSFSPNGREIAYTGNVVDIHGYITYAGTIDVVPATGGKIRRLAPGLGGDSREPQWSPNGRWIAFTNTQSDPLLGPGMGPTGLYLVRPDGSDLHKLAMRISGRFAWSPDSRQIAVSDGVGRIIRLDVSSRQPLKIRSWDTISDPVTTDIAWSPDGSRIAWVEGINCVGECSEIDHRSLWFLDVATGRSRKVRSVVSTYSLPWNGSTIAWLRTAPPRLAVYAGDRTVILGRDGHKLSSVRADGGSLSPGSGSPDGRKLLFVASPGGYDSAVVVANVVKPSGPARLLTQG